MAKQRNPLFFPIDRLLFEQVNKFKNSMFFAKISDQLNNLRDQEINIINIAILSVVTILPLIFLASIFFSNMSAKSQLAEKYEILRLIDEIDHRKKVINNTGRDFISSTPIASDKDMENVVIRILSKNEVDLTKVKVMNFYSEPAHSIQKNSAKVTFTNFSLTDLSSLFQGLTTKHKMKIGTLSIDKSKDNGGLNGDFSLIHYSKL